MSKGMTANMLASTSMSYTRLSVNAGRTTSLVAECNCGPLKEGANRSQLPCGQNCRYEDRCLLLISCPATTWSL